MSAVILTPPSDAAWTTKATELSGSGTLWGNAYTGRVETKVVGGTRYGLLRGDPNELAPIYLAAIADGWATVGCSKFTGGIPDHSTHPLVRDIDTATITITIEAPASARTATTVETIANAIKARIESQYPSVAVTVESEVWP